jgi:hypothetical protein
VHHDTHEVISLQVAGSKRWLVYEPVLELPLKNQRYRSALGEPGEPVLDPTARAGDTLYLPRGWLHQALTTDSDSLHITIGVNVRRWVDEARVALDQAEAELPYRRTIDAAEPPELPELDASGSGRGRASASSVRGDPSSTASSRSCARSLGSPPTTSSSGGTRSSPTWTGRRSSSRERRCGCRRGSPPSSSSWSRSRRPSAPRAAGCARRRGPARARQAARARGVPAT